MPENRDFSIYDNLIFYKIASITIHCASAIQRIKIENNRGIIHGCKYIIPFRDYYIITKSIFDKTLKMNDNNITEHTHEMRQFLL